MNGIVQRCLVAALALALGACSGSIISALNSPSPPPASKLNVSDDYVLQPAVRVVVQSESSSAPSDPHTGNALEVGYIRGSGTSSQDVSSNYVSFGDTRFNAPTRLDSSFTLAYVDMTWRGRLIDRDSGLGLDLLVGIAGALVDLEVASASERRGESLSSPGGQVGLGVLWRAREGTSLHARGVWFRSFDDTEISRGYRYDVALAQALGRNVALRAGYSWWRLQSDRGGTSSPIIFDIRGPTLALELLF